MESFNESGVKYTWCPDRRILHNTFAPNTHATRAMGILVVRNIKRWLSGSKEPYALLVDGDGAVGIDTGYREEFARLFEEYANVTLAVYDFPVETEAIPILFGLGTGVKLKAFDNETEARAWLAEEGFHTHDDEC